MAIPPGGTTTPNLWLDAAVGVYVDAGVTPATNGQTVQQWNDQSGNGNNATQATSTNRPTFTTGLVNSLPALVFDGIDNFMSHTNTGEIGTVFIVYSFQGPIIEYGAMMSADTSDAIDLGAYYISPTAGAFYDTTGAQSVSRTTTNDTGNVSWNIFSSPVVNIFDQMGIRNDGTNLSLYKRGVQMGASVAKPAAARPITSPVIGAGTYLNSTAGQYIAVTIAEIIMYSTNLSDGEFAAVAAGLNSKYNLATTPSRFVWFGFEGPYTAPGRNENLIIMTSADAQAWPQVLPSHYIPAAGHRVRDVTTVWDPATSAWWMAHTNVSFGATGTTFDIAKSVDPGPPNYPVTFTYVTSVDISYIPLNITAWSPVWCRIADGSLHLIIHASSTPIGPFQPYELRPTNASFTTWSTAALVTGTGLDVISVIVGPPFYDAGTYYMYLAYYTGPNSHIDLWTSTSPFSGYSLITSNIYPGVDYEGPFVIRNTTGQYQLMIDQLGNGMYYATSSSPGSGWSATTGWGSVPIGAPSTPENGAVIDLGVTTHLGGSLMLMGVGN